MSPGPEPLSGDEDVFRWYDVSIYFSFLKNKFFCQLGFFTILVAKFPKRAEYLANNSKQCTIILSLYSVNFLFFHLKSFFYKVNDEGFLKRFHL